MASYIDRTKMAMGAICALLASSGMLFFGTGLHPVWWLIWLAALPVLLRAPRISGLAAFGIASLSCPFALVTAAVPVRHDATLYTRYGDWFAWLDVGALMAMLGGLIFKRVAL